MVYPDDVPRLKEALLKCASSGEPAECIYRVHGEGKDWRQVRAVRLPYAGNRVPTLLAVVVDITSIRQSQEFALQNEYDMTINKTMSELYDEVFEIDYVNQAVITRFSKFAKKRKLGIQLPLSSTSSMERWFAENRPLNDDGAEWLRSVLFDAKTSIDKLVETVEYQRRIPNGEVILLQATLLQINASHSLLCTVNKAKLKSNKL